VVEGEVERGKAMSWVERVRSARALGRALGRAVELGVGLGGGALRGWADRLTDLGISGRLRRGGWGL